MTNMTNGTGTESNIPGFSKVDPDQTTKYKKNYGAHKSGMSVKEVADYYTSWAKDYEKVNIRVQDTVSRSFPKFTLIV